MFYPIIDSAVRMMNDMNSFQRTQKSPNIFRNHAHPSWQHS